MKVIGALLAFLVCFMMDYQKTSDPFLLGKQRILFIVAPFFIPLLLKKQWVPALLLAYGLAFWAHHNFLIYSVMDLGCFALCVAAAQFLLLSPKEYVARCFVFFGAIQGAYGILQTMNIQLLYGVQEEFFQKTPLAFMGQHTVLGGFLVACLAPALWMRMWICAGLIFICAVCTGSSTTYMSLWALCVLYACYLGYGRLTIISQAAFFAGLFSLWWKMPGLELFSLKQRPALWAEGMRAFRANPWFGGGAGFWAAIWHPINMPLIEGFRPTLLHSELMTLLVEYGRVGFIIFALGLFVFIKNFKLTWHHALCVAILVNGLANFPFHIVPMGIIFLWSLGCCSMELKMGWMYERCKSIFIKFIRRECGLDWES